MFQTFHKTRIAPTPSGFLHLGNAMSFIITARLAKQTGAGILLRIDDLDRQRITDAFVQDVFDALEFLEIEWTEGPRNLEDYKARWSQIHRMALYNEALNKLSQSGQVYACTCSRTQIDDCNCFNKKLSLDHPNAAWRVRSPADVSITVKTLNEGLVQTQLPPEMRDFVVRKKDGFPAYQLASVIDDLHFGIDLVVRGEDLWPSTIAQHYLADVLQQPDFKKITFHHHHLLMVDGEKLSKSAGDTSIKYLREQGKKATDILNEIDKLIQSLPRV